MNDDKKPRRTLGPRAAANQGKIVDIPAPNQRIRDWRMHQMKLTTTEFAALLGMKQSTYYAYEIGRAINLPTDFIEALVKKAGMDLHYIYFGVNAPLKHSEAVAVDAQRNKEVEELRAEVSRLKKDCAIIQKHYDLQKEANALLEQQLDMYRNGEGK